MTENDFEEGYFTFRKFRIHQQRSAMKVGTDAVLLGSWMSLPPVQETMSPACPAAGSDKIDIGDHGIQLMDIGTGTGVISLFAAQRLAEASAPFVITALEPDTPSYEEDVENFSTSPWKSSLNAVNMTLQGYAGTIAEGSMDMIFSNPPYFIDSLKAPDRRRTVARHTDTLPFEEMVEICGRLLKEGGTLAVILPPEEGRRFLMLVKSFFHNGRHFTLTRLCHVSPSANKPVKRWMMELRWSASAPINTPGPTPEVLVLQEGPRRSAEYSRLTKAFYVR